MKKLYEYRKDTWSQHLEDTAIITRAKFISGQSTYKGGTTEYRNYLHINLGFISLFKCWLTKKVTGNYK